MAESKHLTNISDRGVEADSSKTDLNDQQSPADKRRTSTTISFQIFCILWLIPIIALLYLNFSNYIIGPSAWCPKGSECALDPLSPAAGRVQENLLRFNRNNRNLIGVLQLVAKLLEIWFVVIAGTLLFLITMRFAAKPNGLPLGFLTRTTDFPGYKEVFDPMLWNSRIKGSGRNLGFKVWMLFIFTILLAILCYLMGPATAILAIPTLQWITAPPVGDHYFVGLNSAAPPRADASSWFALYSLTSWQNLAKQCSINKFAQNKYACTEDPLGFALDQWLDTSLASHGAVGTANFVDPSYLQVTFSVNATYLSADNLDPIKHYEAGHSNVYTDMVWWVPSRQILANLTSDLNAFRGITYGLSYAEMRAWYNDWWLYHDDFDSYVGYNKSLALEFQRNGPIIGFVPTMWQGDGNSNHWTLDLGVGNSTDTRLVRCYENYDLSKVPFGQYYAHDLYTKCIRIGSGWSSTNKNVSFTVPGYFSSKTGEQDPDVTVDIYSSDRAVFLSNGVWPSWFPNDCLTNATASSATCDWERLFTVDETTTLANLSSNVITTEMTTSNGTNTVTWAVDFVAFYGFTNYILDTSLITNPTSLVRTGNLPITGPSIAIDPNWLLAGWSVSNGEALSTQRTSATLIQQVMSAILKYGRMDATLIIRLKTHALGFLPIAHAMSLIDHQLTTTPKPSWPTEEHPLMQREAKIYAWGYFMASRTAILGVIVVLGGVIVVLLQVYFGFVDRRPYRDAVELLASALQHVPQGEFDDKGNDERAISRMRFQMEDRGGKTVFNPS